MWRPRSGREEDTVVCIACGDEVDRSSAREYDKYGNRWDRVAKDFEYVCRDCHDDLSHQPRDGLEALLTQLDTGDTTQEAFLADYWRLVEDGDDAAGDRR